jgi:hypothetical protein
MGANDGTEKQHLGEASPAIVAFVTAPELQSID